MPSPASRGTISSLSISILVAIVVAAAVGTTAVGQLPASSVDGVSLSLSVDPTTGRILVLHRSGPALDVRQLRVQIRIGGRPLAMQPPIPFFAAPGFRGGPTGPFNSAADPIWTVGERAGVRVASTNRPHRLAGHTVTVRLYREGRLVGVASATAGGHTVNPRQAD